MEKTTDMCIVLPFRAERDMLEKYLELYEYINPSIVTGWNIDYFDTPMLYNRIKRLLGERQANRLSPIGKCFWSPYRKRYFMAGVSYLDYISLYKIYNYGELPNYRLDTVAKIELDRGKIEYQGNLDQLFKEDIEKFIEYNLVDVELVVVLDDDPDSYVVAPPVYPPSILVLEPLTFVCVSAERAGPPKSANKVIKIINIPVK